MIEQQRIKMPPKTKESFFLYFKIFCTKVRINKFGSSSSSSSSSVGKLSFATLKEYWKILGRKFIQCKLLSEKNHVWTFSLTKRIQATVR